MPGNGDSQGKPDGGGGAPPGAGEQLRTAREAAAMSVEQVADALHLDERAVEALESGRFAELGAPVFVRGYLRAYAQLLKQPERAILDAYESVRPTETAAPVVTHARDRSVTINPVSWAVFALVFALAGALVIYVFRDEPPATVSLSRVDEAPAVAEPAPFADRQRGSAESPEVPAATPATEAEDSDAVVPAALAPAPEPEAVEVPEPVSTPATRLSLYFRGESWVEISDANRRLLFGLQREGIRRELRGDPPFRFLLGNAPAVDIYVDDEPYEVPADRLTGNVARFELTVPQDE